MTQQELDIHVALATGESVAEIKRRGFCIADSYDVNYDPEPRGPFALDWDRMEPVMLRWFE